MFLSVADARALTTFDEVAALDDASIDRYIRRADSWIRRATKRSDLSTSTNADIQQDLQIATLLLLEYIWFWDQVENKEIAIGHDEVVKIGSYTFNKDRAMPGEKTGNQELDGILESLKFTPKVGSFFSISKGEKA